MNTAGLLERKSKFSRASDSFPTSEPVPGSCQNIHENPKSDFQNPQRGGDGLKLDV